MMFPNGLSRRRFFHAAGLAAFPCLWRRRARRSVVCGKDGECPRLRFVQWNDTHVETVSPTNYRLANEKQKYLVDCINSATHFPIPDFVVAVGDMIHGGDLESLLPDFNRFKTLTAGLKCPLYPVIGNHENVQQEGNDTYEAPYRKTFGENRLNYTFRHGGILFVMLNDSGAPGTNRLVGQRRNRWLRDVLESSKDVPKIICCHIPLIPIRDEPVLKKSFGFTSYISHDDQLLELVDSHADSVIAVLSGHLHLTGVVQRKGVYHIVPSGTASYPCDFAGYEVFGDRIRVRMYSLPDHLLTPETNIHGKRRHGIDYTDATHQTHESYIRGNRSERAFEIDLSGGKVSGTFEVF